MQLCTNPTVTSYIKFNNKTLPSKLQTYKTYIPIRHINHHENTAQHITNIMYHTAALWVLKAGDRNLQFYDRQQQISDGEDTGVQNFNFSPKFPKWGFLAPNY